MTKRTVCVVTGSRAEYGLLRGVMREIADDPRLELQVIATGMHLAPEFGNTFREIEADGFRIDTKVEMLLSSDTPLGVTKSVGLGIMGMGGALNRLKPDLVLLLGDRFEIMAAAIAATIAGIPIAHIHGGEVTEGVMDDAFRHAITKMSHLHFTSAEGHSTRVIQMGEDPERVFNVGAPGVDEAKGTQLLDRARMEEELEISLRAPVLLVTYHPVLIGGGDPAGGLAEVLSAIGEVDGTFVFTRPNADPGGRVLNGMIDSFVASHPGRATAVTSLGQRRYVSMLALADIVIGNSSSGLIEAPAMGTPTINVGSRQSGRLRGDSVIDASENKASVRDAIEKALSPDFRAKAAQSTSPYGSGGAAKRIKDAIASADLSRILTKRFHAR
jgi:UDP-N-acetylglucosamine 2-epimerase (non-hydrolysing)/GDP/UDP-N,N'-diacetylbacillosamine 2-epimerase (hydrolysing)